MAQTPFHLKVKASKTISESEDQKIEHQIRAHNDDVQSKQSDDIAARSARMQASLSSNLSELSVRLQKIQGDSSQMSRQESDR